jgi:hypothetical protein
MFYCKPCGAKREWPVSNRVSLGPCELCGHSTECSDVPATALPMPGEKKPDAIIEMGQRHEDSSNFLRADCTSDFSIEKDGNSLTLTLTITGLPEIVMACIIDRGNELTVPLITTVINTVGGKTTGARSTSEYKQGLN